MKQEEALNILKMGHNVYLTGEAGSGKTYVLNNYISWLKEKKIKTAVTASTGIAATHLDGSTIHSWSGIGVKDFITPTILDQLEQKRNIWNRFQETEVLIIDEISMLPGSFLDMCDIVARHLKRIPDKPFGGLQIVLCGDFFQLPPIKKNDYAFQSRIWSELQLVICYLKEQYRQEDYEFLELLSSIRSAKINEKHKKYLFQKCRSYNHNHNLLCLYTHNEDVDKLNEEHLNIIKTKEYFFEMTSKGKDFYVDSLKKGCLAPEVLRLKEGAKVMFVKNDPKGTYVNGTQGTVIGFNNNIPLVKTNFGTIVFATPVSWKKEEDEKVLAEIKQIPLRLAWAITIHKSQGMTLDEAEMDLSQCFVPGQGYVALSRVKSFNGLYLKGLNQLALEVDRSVLQIDINFHKKSNQVKKRLEELSDTEIEKYQKSFIISRGGSFDVLKNNKFKKESTLSKTKDFLIKGLTIEEIAKNRNLSIATIISHAEKIIEQETQIDFSYLAPNKKILSLIESAVFKHSFEKIYPIKKYLDKLGYDLSYDYLRQIRLFLISRDLKHIL